MCCIVTQKVEIPEKIVRSIPVDLHIAEEFFRLLAAERSALVTWREKMHEFVKFGYEMNEDFLTIDGGTGKGIRFDYVDGNLLAIKEKQEIWY